MHQAWWISAIGAAAPTLVITVAMSWMAHSRMTRRPENDVRCLVHPLSTFLIGVVCSGLFFALIVMSTVVWPNPTATWGVEAVFAFFAILAAWLVAIYFYEKHEVSDEGLAYTTLFGARRSLRWNAVCTLSFAPRMQWFRIEDTSGSVARLSVMLMGLPEFARVALKHVPAAAIDPETLQILHETANGSPPPIRY